MADDGSAMPGAAGPGPAGRPDLLAEMTALRRRARSARHAYWFPLVLFGVLTVASVPFYIQPTLRPALGASGAFIQAGGGGPWMPFLGGAGGLVRGYLGYYWSAALLGGLVLSQLWYWWHARRVGLQTPARGYLMVTGTLTVLAVALPPLSRLRSPHWLWFLHRLPVFWPGDLVVRGTFPYLIIAAGLVVLAWAERSRALAATAVVYTGAALLAVLYDVSNLAARLGWTPPPGAEMVPNVLLPGLVLLLAGAAAFAVQWRTPAAA